MVQPEIGSKTSKRRRGGMLALLSPAMWCTLAGCAPHQPAAPSAAVVVALPVHPQSAADALRFPAEVAARYSNAASFRVAGKLVERSVRLGDTIHQGQVLARLDPADAQQQSSAARATLDAAEHRLMFAQQQLDRDRAQSAQNLIASTQLEQTEDSYTTARDARDQAAAQLAVAQNNLRYNTLRAEHDGLISSENADTGQVVAAGQPVYVVAWSGDIDVTLDAPEGRLGAIAVGDPAHVTFPILPNRSFDASVREIAPTADPSSRTYRVKLTLRSADPEVHLGMTGEAVLTPLHPVGSEPRSQVFVLPATAIFHRGTQPAVWRVSPSDSTLELRAVSASRYDDRTATITAGLNDGDLIVLAGVHTVYAGERVRPVAPLFTPTTPKDAAATIDGGPGSAR